MNTSGSIYVRRTEAHEIERHLLYVAWICARDHLFVSGVRPVSDVLMDLT